jgi:hypothetical protein
VGVSFDVIRPVFVCRNQMWLSISQFNNTRSFLACAREICANKTIILSQVKRMKTYMANQHRASQKWFAFRAKICARCAQGGAFEAMRHATAAQPAALTHFGCLTVIIQGLRSIDWIASPCNRCLLHARFGARPDW